MVFAELWLYPAAHTTYLPYHRYLQTRFYEEFPLKPIEKEKYLFSVGSSMKPTQISTPPGSLNIIPPNCTVKGDIRFTPFYDINVIKKKMEEVCIQQEIFFFAQKEWNRERQNRQTDRERDRERKRQRYMQLMHR